MFTWDNIIHVQKHESHKRKHHYQPFTRHVCWLLSTLRTASNPTRPTAHYAAQTHTECDEVGAGGEWPEAREQDRNRHIIFSWSVYYTFLRRYYSVHCRLWYEEALLFITFTTMRRPDSYCTRRLFIENSWENDVTCRGIINLKDFLRLWSSVSYVRGDENGLTVTRSPVWDYPRKLPKCLIPLLTFCNKTNV